MSTHSSKDVHSAQVAASHFLPGVSVSFCRLCLDLSTVHFGMKTSAHCTPFATVILNQTWHTNLSDNLKIKEMRINSYWMLCRISYNIQGIIKRKVQLAPIQTIGANITDNKHDILFNLKFGVTSFVFISNQNYTCSNGILFKAIIYRQSRYSSKKEKLPLWVSDSIFNSLQSTALCPAPPQL